MQLTYKINGDQRQQLMQAVEASNDWKLQAEAVPIGYLKQ